METVRCVSRYNTEKDKVYVQSYGEKKECTESIRVNYGAQSVEEEQLLCGYCVFWCLKPVEKPVCAQEESCYYLWEIEGLFSGSLSRGEEVL